MTTGRPSEPHPAATVVVLRPGADGPEVLLTRRPASMAFAADVYVFPGGRVDPTDADPRLVAGSARSAREAALALGGNLPGHEALALHHAAIRELFEEAGVLLADEPPGGAGVAGARLALLAGASLADAVADLAGSVHLAGRLRTDRLAPIAHWTTPPFMPRRYSTWFFVADLPAGAEPTFADGEVVDHRWLGPRAALEQVAAGEIGMWVPTTSVLERLVETGATTAAEVAERIRLGPVSPPRVDEVSAAIVRFTFGAVGALPGRSGIATLHGRRELVLVDPGDPSDAALDAIAEVVSRREGAIRAIVLTASDPDHAAAAEAIAIPSEIPILVAPGAGRHLP
ncbi:MAG TPA: NUDIX domain-containing protein, partial [Candidatus Deferrimicrobium sp.]|nr:NUDIX domain-containing protein [Candidatus Deferrimicrobium sp.]